MYGVNVKEILYSILINSTQQQNLEEAKSYENEKTL
jgi:hypothetical protein